ncbi:M3 family metallopeptidase [Bacillus salitolerans]|uniref:M3 family metallopeptidase n=1 Tax=Bacillus salitolerans TaxID=1437434 RepID=A0ABW4LWD1_9BACI
MELNFTRLLHIRNRHEWKRAYDEEIVKLDQLYQEEERLYYEMYANGKESKRLDEIVAIKHDLMTNDHIKETLLTWQETFKDDPIWHRRLEVFLSQMKIESLDSKKEVVEIQRSLQKRLMESTFSLNGEEYNLSKVHSSIMESSDRELRQKLLRKSVEIGERNEALLKLLIHARNQVAHELGFENYFDFRCSLKEIDFETYITEMNRLLVLTNEASSSWNDRIKKKFGVEALQYYDIYYTAFNFHHIKSKAFSAERMDDVLIDSIKSLGISLQQIPVSIECLEIPYGGFCTNINPKEIKLVVGKRDSISAFVSGIHELGHAIDGCYGSYQYPELYRFHSSIAAETIAELFQTIASDKEFLQQNFHLQDDDYAQIVETNKLMNLLMVKMNYYHSLVEYNMYKNPDQRFKDMASECYEWVFGFRGETFHPASEMFYVEYPVFFQDYNFALASRDMIRHKYKVQSLYNEKEVFEKLLETFIVPNQLFSWKQRVEKMCGKPHTFEYLAKSLL